MNPKALVTRDIADLVPQFLRSRRIEIESLRAGLAMQDEARLLELGQRMYAVGNPYGFQQITTLGRHIMESSLKRDFDSLRSLIAQYTDYLAKVEIVHIDRPAPAPRNVVPGLSAQPAPSIPPEAQTAGA